MFTLVNVIPAIKEHFVTLKKDSSTFGIIVLFFILPLLISFLFLWQKITASEKILNSLITSFAIFIGLIINLLVLLIDRKKGKERVKKQLIEHLSYNSIYELVIGLIVLFISIIFLAIQEKTNSYFTYTLSFILYFLMFNFIMTLLMIAKRFFVLFKNNFDK